MTKALLKTDKITKVYHTSEVESHVLKEVNLEIYAGEFVSISGPSGCGKSTLLSILGLLDSTTSGSYIIDDKNVVNLSVAERAKIRNEKIGFIFQSFNLIDELNVFENVALPLTYSKKAISVSEIKERVLTCLEQVELSHRINHSVSQLSGGQQQRVAIARALVTKPEILLVDEATGNLDAENSEVIMDLLLKLNEQGTTICMVTHEPKYSDMASRKLILKDGKILEKSSDKSLKEAI